MTKAPEGHGTDPASRPVNDAAELSAEQYSVLFTSIDEGLCTIEVLFDDEGQAIDYRFLRFNPAFSRQTGFGNEVMGKTMRALAPKHEEFWYRTYGHIARTGESLRFEHRAKALDRYYDVYAFRIGDPALHQVAVLFNDISERKRAEDRQTFLLHLSDALRPLSDPVAVQGAAMEQVGRHFAVNRALYVEVQADQDTLQPGPAYVDGVDELPAVLQLSDFGAAVTERFRRGEVLVADDIEADARWSPDVYAAFAAIGVRATIGIPLVKNDRLVAIMTVHQLAPRTWSADDVALLQEVAERTWSAVERARAEAALRDADRRKDEFLAVLAHELRNPLAPISNALRLMRAGQGRLDADALRGIIERQVAHMVRLVDDLLDVSRISRGVIELHRETIDLRRVLQAAIETSRPAIERGTHALALQMPGVALPVDGDAVRLAQIFANLLNNAAKYSDDGSRIVLTAERDGDEVVTHVRDSGIGIAPSRLPYVFEPFAKSDRHRARAQGGLGIGLSLAQRLAGMHGGSILAASAGEGLGSTFTVRLPLATQGMATADADADADAGADADQPNARPDLGGLEVLVVDDNRDAADTLAALLRQRGATTMVAHDGMAALAILERWRPAAVLLDLGMPIMGGYETAARIRADRRLDGILLIALTGWGQASDRERTRAAGFDHHLTKPVELDTLLTVLAARGPLQA